MLELLYKRAVLFNSYEFIFMFLPISIYGYFKIGGVWGSYGSNIWLVMVSLFFYGYWDVYYIPLLLASILFNYFLGEVIENSSCKKYYLSVGIVGNLLLLFYFKYIAFFISSINNFGGLTISVPQIVLPLGISFFTFTQTAYLLDAYRGETRKYSFLNYILFVTIFPHLIAGPIINHKKMIPQFIRFEKLKINYENLTEGIVFFIIGLFKKVVIADMLSPWVTLIFNHSNQISFIEAWIGAIGYTLQLYFDFSGYSEMAIGIGLMLNLTFPVNFNSPYQASSIIDFWRRWHITLSEFLKNNLYILLGGSRHGEFKKMRNLLITMLLGGLWHGAGWNFIIWGGLHGVYLMINHLWRKTKCNLPIMFSWGITSLCVIIAWVFFRANTVSDAISILQTMFNIKAIIVPNTYEAKFYFLKNYGVTFDSLPYLALGIKQIVIIFFLGIWVSTIENTQKVISYFKPSFSWLILILVLFLISITKMNSVSEFLYFQF